MKVTVRSYLLRHDKQLQREKEIVIETWTFEAPAARGNEFFAQIPVAAIESARQRAPGLTSEEDSVVVRMAFEAEPEAPAPGSES